jgi:hypothetical protein
MPVAETSEVGRVLACDRLIKLNYSHCVFWWKKLTAIQPGIAVAAFDGVNRSAILTFRGNLPATRF